MKLYFGYGSNMCDTQMRKRCPQSRKLGVAHLLGYRWIISKRGYANVVESKEDHVEGVLYELSKSDESSLDGYEGVSTGSYRKAELAVLRNGEEVVALVYLDPVTAEGTPRAEYIQRINSGLADARLSEEYVARYVRPFIPA